MALLRLRRAARELDISVSTLRILIQSGQLPSVRPSSRSVRIRDEDLAAFLRKRRPNGNGQ